MLSHKILTRSDIGKAASYYEDAADDYYGKDGEAAQWQGQGAQRLGLEGPVEHERLRQLFAGQVDQDQYVVRAATRHDSKQRIGIDLTFSAPKSVSIQALVGGDGEVVKAHDRAVARAVEAAEARAQARHKVRGHSMVQNTGNLVVAKFRHETSREKDPQLHTHAVVMNVTQRADGQWRALKNDDIVKATKYLGAVYRAELARELQQLGYQLRHERDGMFELAHISRQQLDEFSRRSSQVEAKLQAQGLTRKTATAAQKQMATLQTRRKKDARLDRDALQQEWLKRSRELGMDFQRRDWRGAGAEQELSSLDRAPETEPVALAAARSLRYAINHLTERQAVMKETELIDTALKHAVGVATLRDIEAAMQREQAKGFLIREAPTFRPASAAPNDPGFTRAALVAQRMEQGLSRPNAQRQVQQDIRSGALVPMDVRYTTQPALEREKRILQIERDGRGQLEPILARETAQERLSTAQLTQGQRDAALLMLASSDRVVGVQGSAGTGKSHMLDTAIREIERQGCKVRALAPYGSQVKALREHGVPAHTVAAFLRGKDKDLMGPKTVLVIDEAGVMPTRLMEQTLKLAEERGARVVLMGDTAQTKAIEAGRPFDQLQAAGMATARMAEIQRQKDPELKRAVELVVEGNAVASLAHIRSIQEIADGHERERAVAAAFVALPAAERDSTLIVSGTNDSRRHINATVREALQLAGRGIEYDTLIRRDTTQAERRVSRNYRSGDVIQPERDYVRSGLRRDEVYEVLDTGPGNRLTVASKDGVQTSFNPATHRHISVYEPERSELAPGDVVRITRNDATLDLTNGDRMKVHTVSRDSIVLTDGRRRVELPADKPLHLDHAYATTVHSAQGLTSDRVLVNADSRSLTTARDVYYVAISRARHEAQIFTDDRHRLPVAIQKDHEKHAALDLPRQHGAYSHDRQQATPAAGLRHEHAHLMNAGLKGPQKSIQPVAPQVTVGISQAEANQRKARDMRGPELGG